MLVNMVADVLRLYAGTPLQALRQLFDCIPEMWGAPLLPP